jgi:hypothetical protein
MKIKTPEVAIPVMEDQSSRFPAFLPAEREVLSGMLDSPEFLDACLSAGVSEVDFSYSDHRLLAVLYKTK